MENKKTDAFFEKNFSFLKTATVNQLDVEGKWTSKVSQNYEKLENWFFFPKKYGSSEKTLKFSKIADGIKSDVECNWYSMTLRKFNIWVIQKNRWFFWKRNLSFLKQVEDSQFDIECEWNGEISQNVQKLGFFQKKRIILKSWSFSKFTDGGKFAVECNSVECNSICQISQKHQTIWAVLEKCGFFGKKSWIFRKWLEVAILLYNASETVRFPKTFAIFGCFKKNYMGSSKKLDFFLKQLKVWFLP